MDTWLATYQRQWRRQGGARGGGRPPSCRQDRFCVSAKFDEKHVGGGGVRLRLSKIYVGKYLSNVYVVRSYWDVMCNEFDVHTKQALVT